VQNDMPNAVIWSKSKSDVGFQYGGCLGEFHGMSSQSHLSYCRVLPLGEFTVMHQIRFRPGLRPGPRWGSSRRPPRPPSRLGRGYPLPIPHPIDAFGVSVAYGDSTSRLRRSIVDPPSSRNFPLNAWGSG